MPKRAGLGKGLDALIPAGAQTTATASPSGVTQVAVDLIQRNPRQPREKFDLEELENLNVGPVTAESASGYGLPPSAMMLTLLTYCYATGVYGSGDIELNIRHDPMTRYLCAKIYPDIDAIRSFRRDNRPRIIQNLSAVLRRVWELRFCGDEAEPMDGLDCALGLWTGMRAVSDFDREAEERLVQAVRADSMALDV